MAQNTSPWSDWTAPTAGTLGGFNPNTAMFGSKRDALNTNDAMAIMSGDKRRMAQLGIRHEGDPFAFTKFGMEARADKDTKLAVGQQQFQNTMGLKNADFRYDMAKRFGVMDVPTALGLQNQQYAQESRARGLGIAKTEQDIGLAATQRQHDMDIMNQKRKWELEDAAVQRAHGMTMAQFQADVNGKVAEYMRDGGYTKEQAQALVRQDISNRAAKLAQDVEAGKPGTPGGPKLSDDGKFYWSENKWKPINQAPQSIFNFGSDGKHGATSTTPSATQPAAPAKMSPWQRSQAEKFIKDNANATDTKVKAQVEGWRRALAAQSA